MVSRLGFTVAYASGEDMEYPATELNMHSPHTRGWQSPRFCEYPQELGLALAQPARVTQVQLLSHQSKIATRIELFVGDGQSYDTATWKRLGYLSLADNSRSEYQARELKSVYIDSPGSFLKLLVHTCYVNKHNIFNQVGIVAVNLLGEPSAGGGVGGGGVPALLAVKGAGGGPRPAGPMDELAFDMSLDPESAARVRQIVAAKEQAVAREDYDAAKRLKAAEGELVALGLQLAQLEAKKRSYVAAEDYDRAKQAKLEVDALRAQLQHSLRAVEGSLGTDLARHSPTRPGYGGGYGPPPGHPQQMPPQQQQMAPYGGAPGDPYAYDPQQPQSMQPQQQQPPPGYGPDPAGYYGQDPYLQAPDERPLGGQAAAAAAQGGGMAPPPDPRFDSSVPPGGPAAYRSPGGADAHNDGNDGGYGQEDGGGPAYPPSGGRDAMGGGGGLRHSNEISPGGFGGGGNGPGMDPTIPNGGEYPPGYDPSGLIGNDQTGGDGGDGLGPAVYLEGVPNAEDLPPPDPLPAGALVGDGNELMDLVRLLGEPNGDAQGEYLVRCLLSKAWSLREAAVSKAKLALVGLGDGHLTPQALYPGLCKLLLLGVEDKIAQVFLTALQLLEECCVLFSGWPKGAWQRDLQHKLDGVAHCLVLKLGDNQPRVREAAFDALLALAACPPVGCEFVVKSATRKLPLRQTGKVWRPLACRLQLLRDLADDYGVGPGSGLSVEAAMQFAFKDNEAPQHTFQEVRDAARELAVALYKRVGRQFEWEPFLQLLRAKQREEYERAFEDGQADPRGDGTQYTATTAAAPQGTVAYADETVGGSVGGVGGAGVGGVGGSGSAAGVGRSPHAHSPPNRGGAGGAGEQGGSGARGRGRGGRSPAPDAHGGRPPSSSGPSGGPMPNATVPSQTDTGYQDDGGSGIVGDGGSSGPVTDRGAATPRSNTMGSEGNGDEVGAEDGDGGEEDDDEVDGAIEDFKDQIMKQLEESAFSIEEAHNILTMHFGVATGDVVKDAVLAEWCGEVGLTGPVAAMTQPERLDALDRVAKWLFQ